MACIGVIPDPSETIPECDVFQEPTEECPGEFAQPEAAPGWRCWYIFKLEGGARPVTLTFSNWKLELTRSG